MSTSSSDADIARDILNVDGWLVRDGVGLIGVGRKIRIVLVAFVEWLVPAIDNPSVVWLDHSRLWCSKYDRTYNME